ncbi:LysR substrate-binding domain-containing protein [Sphingomonas olei]
MELRHIRYFLAVAEEGNFTRAAVRVGIGQPPLSQQIRDLEREIGTPLFHRVPHGAELTEAGVAFLAAVRTMPAQVGEAIRAAQRAGRGEAGVLRVGFTGSAAMNPLVPGAIRTFRRRYPEVELALHESNSTSLGAALRDGTIDVAFLRPANIELDDMRVTSLPDEPMVLALPTDHPALPSDRQGSMSLTALRDDLFVLTPRAIGPTLFDAAVRACEAAGFTPRLGQPAPQVASVLALVAAEEGVSIVPASMQQLALAGVAYHPIAGATPLAPLALAHLRGNRAPTVGNFLLTMRSAVHDSSG